MRKWLLTTLLTTVAGYAWKNRHRLLGGQYDGTRSVSGPDRYRQATTDRAQA